MRFARRVGFEEKTNEITRRLADLRSRGTPVLDLTGSNPTSAGLPYPAGLLAPLATDAALRYEPESFGLPSARAAVAADYARRGAIVDAGCVVLTASTSEAYSWLFKLLCDPGDSVLVPQPSYPLFEHLTQLEGVVSAPYRLEYHRRWTIDFASIDEAPASTRALVVVSPNNPTGSYLSRDEFARLGRLCAERNWALIADEVFVDYRLDADDPATDLAARDSPALTFTLGGFSKALGLPQLKLGWIVIGGPAAMRQAALGRLELIADSFLSVGTPIQLAAPTLLSSADGVRRAIHARVVGNLETLRQTVGSMPSCELLRVEGGWSAVVRVPATRPEEQLVIDLLTREHVLVHPGYFFDFPREAYVVLSLLVEPAVFRAGVDRLVATVAS